MLQLLGVILFLLGAGDWLLGKMSKRPDESFRAVSLGCGLFLAVGMTIGGIYMLGLRESDFGDALMYFAWAAFGVVVMVQAAKK